MSDLHISPPRLNAWLFVWIAVVQASLLLLSLLIKF